MLYQQIQHIEHIQHTQHIQHSEGTFRDRSALIDAAIARLRRFSLAWLGNFVHLIDGSEITLRQSDSPLAKRNKTIAKLTKQRMIDIQKKFSTFHMLTLVFPRAGHKINLLRSVAILMFVNTLIAVFLTYVVGINAPFQIIWVFSVVIGTCISILIDGLRWLIWRTNKPNRLAFLLVCAAAAPVGYYIGVTISMLIYGIPIPNLGGFITRSDRAMVIMSVFFSLISGIFFWNQSKLAEFKAEAEKEKARHAAIERQAIQAKLQLLQAQIEPHMLFNTLANLQGLIAIDTERAQYMLEQLIQYLRASLSSSRSDKTTLKQEFELMHAYLELLAIRMGKRLTYQIDLPKELQSLQIAPMLLQPLVENAIKHGVEPKMEGGHIHVSATMDNHVLHLKVIDTGMGLPSNYKDPIAIQAQVNELQNDSATSNIQHVGNENIRDRLFALYGARASLTLSPNQPEGAIAHLMIPL